MTRQWVSADLRTGRVIADLPSVDVDYPLRRTLSNFDTATGHLYLDGAPPNWVRATLEGAAVLACYDDVILDDGTQPRAIEWAGYVTGCTPAAEDDKVDLSLTTLEGYFDRRYVEDETYAGGWRAIVADIVTKYVTDAGTDPGLQLLALDYSGDGAAPDGPLVWQNTDNATVLSRINQLIGQFGGEFTVEWAWSGDGQSLVPTLVFGDRIGQVATLASPAVTFEIPGMVATAQQSRDYSDGRGANKVVAFSSGEGTVTPYAPPVYAADLQGRPTFEYRYSPKTSESDLTVLASYARQALKILAPGAQSVTVSLASTDPAAMRGRRLGVDWRIGDDVGYVIGGVGQDGKDTVPAFPGGLVGVGRVIAYELNDTTVNPIFADPVIYTEGG